MRTQNVIGEIDKKRLLNIKEVCSYVGMGRTNVRKYMDKIGATRKFGGRVLYDKIVIDKYLDSLM